MKTLSECLWLVGWKSPINTVFEGYWPSDTGGVGAEEGSRRVRNEQGQLIVVLGSEVQTCLIAKP